MSSSYVTTYLDFLVSKVETRRLHYILPILLAVSFAISMHLGTQIYSAHSDRITSISTVNRNAPSAYPMPVQEGGFKVCSDGTVVQVKFRSATLPDNFNKHIDYIAKNQAKAAAADCPWFGVGSRLRSKNSGVGYTREAPVIKSLPSGKLVPDATTITDVCPPSGCMVTGPYRQCDRMGDLATCTHFVFLENPVERVVGLYNQYCKKLSEAEGGSYMSFADHPAGVKLCPDMTLVQFAKALGNQYVKEFAGIYKEALATAICDKNEGRSFEEECQGQLESQVNEFTYTEAWSVLQNEVMVFVLDKEYSAGFRSLNQLIGSGSYSHDPTNFAPYYNGLGDGKWDYMPTTKQLKSLSEVLKWDIKLYARGKDIFRKQYKDWKRPNREEVGAGGGL
jgi:hypothetical protein